MKYNHHKYTYENRFNSARHSWTLIGEKGGLHFHVNILEDEKYGPTAGLEIHKFSGVGAPDHVPCWLLHAPCWHDGTSSYAMETLWPMVEPYLKTGEHNTIFKLLEGEATRFGLGGGHEN